MNKRFGETSELRASGSVQLLDTTLRDGEQTPEVSLTSTQKADIARALDHAEVDYIETGSAYTSPDERETIERITSLDLDATMTSFTRGVKSDVDPALDCDVDDVTFVVPASDRRVGSKVGTTHEDVVETTDELVTYTKDHDLWVEVTGKDGSWAAPRFFKSLARTGHDAGTDCFCFTDTVDHTNPERTHEIVSRLPGLGPTSTHIHDDLGLAMVNVHTSLAADANLVHTTINGIGEHAGNVVLKEVIIALDHCYDVESVELDRLYALTQKVVQATGVSLPSNKAAVGQNTFTHEGGIHADETLKDGAVYGPCPPETVGRGRRLVLGKHAGRADVKAALDEHGVDATDEEVTTVVERAKELGDRGKRITGADLLTFAEDVQSHERARQIELLDLTAASGGGTPTASIRLRVEGEEHVTSGTGSGPVSATVKVVRGALGPSTDAQLDEYHVDAITGDTDAIVIVEVTVPLGDRSVSVTASHTDIMRANVQAMVDTFDRLLALNHTSPTPASVGD